MIPCIVQRLLSSRVAGKIIADSFLITCIGLYIIHGEIFFPSTGANELPFSVALRNLKARKRQSCVRLIQFPFLVLYTWDPFDSLDIRFFR